MGLLISETYTTYTPESIEAGDSEDSGFVFEEEEYTFLELIDHLKGYSTHELSNSHDITENTWITDYEYGHGTHDYFTKGLEEQRSLHFSRKNDPKMLKYWIKALNYVLSS